MDYCSFAHSEEGHRHTFSQPLPPFPPSLPPSLPPSPRRGADDGLLLVHSLGRRVPGRGLSVRLALLPVRKEGVREGGREGENIGWRNAGL